MADATQQVSESGLPMGFEEILAKAYEGEPAGNAEVEQALQEAGVPTSDDSPNDAEVAEQAEEVPAPEVEAQGEEEAPEEEDKPLEETPAFKQLGKRAQTRIQQLVESGKQSSAQFEQYKAEQAAREAQYNQYIQQLQYQQQLQAQKLEMELQQYRNEAESIRRAREEESLREKFKSDPVARFEHEVLSKSEKRAQELADSRVAAIEKRLKEQDQAREQAQKAAEQKARFAAWTSQLDQAIPETVLKGVEDKEKADALAPVLKNFLLAYAAAGNEQPSAAAKEFNQVIDSLIDLRSKAKAKAAGAVVAKNKGIPGGSGAAKPAATGVNPESSPSAPPRHVLNREGFSTAWEWYRALDRNDSKARSLIGVKQ